MAGQDHCDWEGIDCNSGYVVVSLILKYNSLGVTIPSSIGNLENLNYLDLRQNELIGPIPASIGNLENLNYLYLNSNT